MSAQTIAYPRRPMDFWLFGTTLILIVVGLLMVLDSSYIQALNHGKDVFYYVKRQAVGAGLGIVLMFLMMRIGYWRLRDWAFPLMVLGLVLLAAVFVPHIGYHANAASRWIGTRQI